MFTSTTHPLVGSVRVYIPQGRSPYRPVAPEHFERVIMFSGDAVEVLSAWTRDYLPADEPTLLYVLSLHTGERTHVTADELPLEAQPSGIR